jgi:tetratricopeptide (TPR) repeat protein
MEHDRADGFILPDGEFIRVDDPARMHEQARKWLKSPREVLEFLSALAQECAAKGAFAAAQGYFELLLKDAENEADTTYCLLSLGQLQEQQENYAAAIDWYRKAFRSRPGADATWYLLHNNLGYCLNRFGLYAEAEELCRKAIAIDPSRHNAHKNLGLALEGQGCITAAAREYLVAARLRPGDRRAFRLLQRLAAAHPQIAGLPRALSPPAPARP